MAITANTFSKCAPSISTNVAQCGSVALCNVQPLTSEDLTDVYMKSDEFRVMEHLLHAEMEIKECGATQNGLFDFLIANKVNMSDKIVPMNKTLTKIAPFVLADQTSPINNEYWLVSGGNDAGGGNWEVIVTSSANIPFDVRSFPVGDRVHIKGQSAAGSATRTWWRIVSVVDNSDNTGTLVLDPINSESHLDTDKLEEPVTGYLTRSINNVADEEQNCNEAPAYLNNKEVPFWIQPTRWSFCKSSAYDEYRELARLNPLYRKFYDLPDTKRNKQIAVDFQKRLVQAFFWSKKLPNQDLGTYNQLENRVGYDGDDLGVDGGLCVGKIAEVEGVYEQLAECGRVADLQGEPLNLPALFRSFYDIIRVRATQGNGNKNIDVFTDTKTAELLNRAMIRYYSSKATDHNGDAILRATFDATGFSMKKSADFGFFYREYPLDWPAGVVFRIITHWAFDDELSVATAAGIENTARVLWVLDFSGIYMGIVASNRVVANTGDLKTLAAVRPDFSCVMKVHTRQQTLNSVTFAVVVECPFGNEILENFAIDGEDNLPAFADDPNIAYPSLTTTTTPA